MIGADVGDDVEEAGIAVPLGQPVALSSRKFEVVWIGVAAAEPSSDARKELNEKSRKYIAFDPGAQISRSCPRANP